MSQIKGDHRIGIGSSSVLMILVVLAMTALGLLALGSARQTEAQTARNLQASLDYYKASASVQQTLGDIDAATAASILAGTPLSAKCYESCSEADIEWEDSEGELRFTITEDAGEGRMLVATGIVSADGDARCKLDSHVLISAHVEETQAIRLIGE